MIEAKKSETEIPAVRFILFIFHHFCFVFIMGLAARALHSWDLKISKYPVFIFSYLSALLSSVFATVTSGAKSELPDCACTCVCVCVCVL